MKPLFLSFISAACLAAGFLIMGVAWKFVIGIALLIAGCELLPVYFVERMR